MTIVVHLTEVEKNVWNAHADNVPYSPVVKGSAPHKALKRFSQKMKETNKEFGWDSPRKVKELVDSVYGQEDDSVKSDSDEGDLKFSDEPTSKEIKKIAKSNKKIDKAQAKVDDLILPKTKAAKKASKPAKAAKPAAKKVPTPVKKKVAKKDAKVS